jgi:hypothetical protein
MALLLCLAAFGCNQPVGSSDLAGTWVITDASRLRLPTELQKAAATIVLNANGMFTASEVPGLFYIPPGRAWLDAGAGAWRLVSRDDGEQVQLDFQSVGDRKTDPPYGTQLRISRGSSSMSLSYSLGDPDEGRRVEFRRKQ